MFGFCFNEKETVRHFNDIAASDEALFKRFYHGMLQEGVYFAPSMYEAGFISSAHTLDDIEQTRQAAEVVLSRLSV
jgi:glutamate-1-semialdehyde 2,1-aminomutase